MVLCKDCRNPVTWGTPLCASQGRQFWSLQRKFLSSLLHFSKCLSKPTSKKVWVCSCFWCKGKKIVLTTLHKTVLCYCDLLYHCHWLWWPKWTWSNSGLPPPPLNPSKDLLLWSSFLLGQQVYTPVPQLPWESPRSSCFNANAQPPPQISKSESLGRGGAWQWCFSPLPGWVSNHRQS